MSHQGSDENLVTALGWEPCTWIRYGHDEPSGPWWFCSTHAYGGYATRPCVCDPTATRLADVRLGMALVLAERL